LTEIAVYPGNGMPMVTMDH